MSRLTNYRKIKNNPFYDSFDWDDHVLLKENNNLIMNYINSINKDREFIYDVNDFMLLEKYMT